MCFFFIQAQQSKSCWTIILTLMVPLMRTSNTQKPHRMPKKKFYNWTQITIISIHWGLGRSITFHHQYLASSHRWSNWDLTLLQLSGNLSTVTDTGTSSHANLLHPMSTVPLTSLDKLHPLCREWMTPNSKDSTASLKSLHLEKIF